MIREFRTEYPKTRLQGSCRRNEKPSKCANGNGRGKRDELPDESNDEANRDHEQVRYPADGSGRPGQSDQLDCFAGLRTGDL